MRNVMIGCPAHDGKVNVRWANSFGATLKTGLQMGVNVEPLFIPGNAMVHDARNEIVAGFIKSGFDDLVFIDADISWHPMDFFKLLNHPVDVVGATYPRKQQYPHMVLKAFEADIPKYGENGLMKVQGLGMGFFRFSKTGILALWEKSRVYKIDQAEERRECFGFDYDEKGLLIGEDIFACRKFDFVWLDPTIILSHIGEREHVYDPLRWFAEKETEQKQIDELAEKSKKEAQEKRQSNKKAKA